MYKMINNNEHINTKQAYWLRKISENDNFYKSLNVLDRALIHNLLVVREYNIEERGDINRIRDLWIRYVNLHNYKDI